MEPVTAESASPELIEQSQPFIGQWNTLISTTNWDKGEIICKWRESLRNADEPSQNWSDEKWSQLVGGVTSQHVGRLRRTYERFGMTFQDYKGLFWSHFYAALDWDDAEMWLEGAIQNEWSISQMRKQRWETLGKIPEDEPKDSDIVSVESEEETQSLALSDQVRDNDREYVEGPRYDEGPDFGDEDDSGSKSRKDRDADSDEMPAAETGPASFGEIRPFESFTELPDDVRNAADAFKVAIIQHRVAEWEAISQADMLGLLDSLKQLVGFDGGSASATSQSTSKSSVAGEPEAMASGETSEPAEEPAESQTATLEPTSTEPEEGEYEDVED